MLKAFISMESSLVIQYVWNLLYSYFIFRRADQYLDFYELSPYFKLTQSLNLVYHVKK